MEVFIYLLKVLDVACKERCIPKYFWAKVASYVVYLLNRFPLQPPWNMIPEEAWSNYKPRVDHFRIFGSVAYIKVPDQKMPKLEDRRKIHHVGLW